jgi:sterol desaturase/sphingolipid hydroxylase (fatty acid hydroxylase superfamily)
MNSVDTREFRIGEGRISGAISLFFGIASLIGVLCFRYPGWFSIPTLRANYNLDLLRNVLFLAILISIIMAGLSFALNRRGLMWIVGVVASGTAVSMGGAEASRLTNSEAALPIGLDWFVLDLLISAGIFIPLERIWAKKPQRILRPEWSTDLTYFAITHLLVQLVILVTTVFATKHLSGFIFGSKEWLRSLPFAVQVALAVFVADFCQYWSHRLYHRVSFLWGFHAVHHSAPHMDWLAGSRQHILELLATRMFVFIPVFLLGFSPEAIYIYVGFVGVQAVFVHTNINWNFGLLRYVFVTPQYHHWHHSDNREYMDKNYAVHLPILDMMFGTFLLPKNEWPETYGVLGPDLPKGLIKQHMYPFNRDRSATGENATPDLGDENSDDASQAEA